MSDSETPMGNEKSPWSWHPELPLKEVPLFVWPARPLAALRWLLGRSFLLSPNLLYVALGVFTWWLFGPRLESCVEFQSGWILLTYALNLGSVVIVAGALHLYFYTFKRQGNEHRLDSSELGTNNPKFDFKDQVWDNICWTLLSGVTIWTAYQVVFMWAYANDLLPWLAWNASPLGLVWFFLLFPLLVVWESMHFYLVHRLLHWKPMYRWHVLHHRNINIGPWSGFSMHPVEHVFYFSTILIHLVVASHPIHMLYHMYFTALAAVTAHTGYSSLVVRRKETVGLGDFFHQLHHRYFDCNYGTATMPWDRWFGSFHDGTSQATARVREYQLEKRGGGKRQTPVENL